MSFSYSDIFSQSSLFVFQLLALILDRLPFGNDTLPRESFIYFLDIFWIKVTIWPMKQAAEEATRQRLLRARSLLESLHALRRRLICLLPRVRGRLLTRHAAGHAGVAHRGRAA